VTDRDVMLLLLVTLGIAWKTNMGSLHFVAVLSHIRGNMD